MSSSQPTDEHDAHLVAQVFPGGKGQGAIRLQPVFLQGAVRQAQPDPAGPLVRG